MDRLEDDLRRVLTDPRRTLPPDLLTLEGVHRGAARRRRVRTAGVALAAVVALAGGVAIGATQLGGGDHASLPAAQSPPASATTTQAPSPSASPSTSLTAAVPPVTVIRGLQAQSFTAIGTRTFFVLGTDPGCGTPPCTAQLVRTADGGRTFTALAALPAPWTNQGQGSSEVTLSDVRFGSARDGWLYGGGLWSTHDGGRTWKHVAMPGKVLDVEAGAGVAWAIVEKADGARLLMDSAVEIDGWADMTPSWATPSTLAVDGTRVVVWASKTDPSVGAKGRSALITTTTAGRSWSTKATPSCTPDLGGRPSASGGGVWLACPTGMLAGVYPRPLTDPSASLDTSAIGHGTLPNHVLVAPRDASTAALGLDADGIAVVTSAGKVLHKVAVGGAPTWIGFSTPSVGYAIVAGSDGGTTLRRTTDGGATWRPVAFG